MNTDKFSTIRINNKLELLKILKGAYFIGYGNTSYCFHLKKWGELKLYKPAEKKEDLFSRFDMIEHIKELSSLKNDTYIAPQTMLIYKETVIGYITEFKKAKTLEKIKVATPIETVLMNLEKLIEDTYLISDKSFHLGDLHNRNILFNGFYYVIDLDFGQFEKKKDNLANWNISDILKAILDSFFRVSKTEILIIDNVQLFNLYNNALYRDYHKIYEFFETFKEELNTSNLTIRKLQKSHLYHKEINTYYRD